MAHSILLAQPCLVKKYPFSISLKTKDLYAQSRDIEDLSHMGPPPSLRNHLLPLPLDGPKE